MKLLYLGYFSSPGVFQKLENAGLDPSTARQNYELGFLHSIIEEELLKGWVFVRRAQSLSLLNS